MRVDLHSHSTYSDGALTPTALVELARRQGVGALALTDHDTVDGVAEARGAAEPLGLELIAGTELSVAHEGQDLHLLAYFLDVEAPELRAHMEALRADRRLRVTRLVARLRLLGIPIEESSILAKARADGAVGRLHVAQVLVEKGWVPTESDAFRWYLGHGGPAYIEKETPDAARSIATLRAAGGVPVLAHPGAYRLEGLLEQLVPAGLLGLEVWHPMHAPADVTRYREQAARFGLLETGGSDYHGNREHEVGPGGLEIGPAILEPIRRAAARLRDGGADVRREE